MSLCDVFFLMHAIVSLYTKICVAFFFFFFFYPQRNCWGKMASSLKPALVLSKTKCTSLGDVQDLNLWGCGLSDVSLLERCLARVVSCR